MSIFRISATTSGDSIDRLYLMDFRSNLKSPLEMKLLKLKSSKNNIAILKLSRLIIR